MEKVEVIRYIETLSFEISNDPKFIIDKIENVCSKRGFEVYRYENSHYLDFVGPSFRILFKDLRNFNFSYTPYIIFLSLFAFLIFLYVWLIKSLKPLNELKNNIKNFSKKWFDNFKIITK